MTHESSIDAIVLQMATPFESTSNPNLTWIEQKRLLASRFASPTIAVYFFAASPAPPAAVIASLHLAICAKRTGEMSTDGGMQAAAAVCAHLMTVTKGRSFLCAREVQIWCGVISCNKLVCVKYGRGYLGRGYLCDMQLQSGVRDGALGVIPPPPLRKYNYLAR